MGYESRIYFAKDYDFPKGIHHSAIVAMIDMCKMGYDDAVIEFRNCFDTETPFSLWVEGYDDENDVECMVEEIEDKYGARLCYASDKMALLDAAIEMEKNSDYWKFEKLRKMIQMFINDNDVYIVHYGY